MNDSNATGESWEQAGEVFLLHTNADDTITLRRYRYVIERSEIRIWYLVKSYYYLK